MASFQLCVRWLIIVGRLEEEGNGVDFLGGRGYFLTPL